MFYPNLALFSLHQTYSPNEPGMRKQMKLATTKTMISEIEKSHKCIIQMIDQGACGATTTIVNDEQGACALDVSRGPTNGEASFTSKMNLPYQSITIVDDRSIEIAPGHRISVVVGDLAQEKASLGSPHTLVLSHAKVLSYVVGRFSFS